jgi:hypothetical protein
MTMSRWEHCTAPGDPYSEDRWSDRFESVSFDDEDTECVAEWHLIKMYAHRNDEGTKLADAYRKSDSILTALPTVLLVGMYAAAACAFFSLAPAWIGFIIGSSIVAIGAVRAFSS